MRAIVILTLIAACTADVPADEYDEDPSEDVLDPEPDPEQSAGRRASSTRRRTPRLRCTRENGAQPFVFDVPETGGSLGNRLIDYVVRRNSDKHVYLFTGVSFVDLAPSDHRGGRDEASSERAAIRRRSQTGT